MTLRWVAGALSDAQGRFRKLLGKRDMKLLLPALSHIIEAERKSA